MPVDERHLQPSAWCMAAVNVVVSETLGSLGCLLTLRGTARECIEVNANHLAAIRPAGAVTAECGPCTPGGGRSVADRDPPRGWEARLRLAPDLPVVEGAAG